MRGFWNEARGKRPERSGLLLGLLAGILIFLYVATTGDWTSDKGIVQVNPGESKDETISASRLLTNTEAKSEQICDSVRSAELYPEENPSSDRIVDQLEYRPCINSSQPLTVLVWGGVANWGGIQPKNGNEVSSAILTGYFQVGLNQVFEREGCEVRNCRISSDRKDLDTADMVIFRVGKL